MLPILLQPEDGNGNIFAAFNKMLLPTKDNKRYKQMMKNEKALKNMRNWDCKVSKMKSVFVVCPYDLSITPIAISNKYTSSAQSFLWNRERECFEFIFENNQIQLMVETFQKVNRTCNLFLHTAHFPWLLFWKSESTRFHIQIEFHLK